MNELVEEIRQWEAHPETRARAEHHLHLCRGRGLTSDWDYPQCTKVVDFASLVLAVNHCLPGGNSLETGVFRGGSAGLILLAAKPDSFHVSVDPFGLPSQAYGNPIHGYSDWPAARRTLWRLQNLSFEQGVTFCHYHLGTLQFIEADLLSHPGVFRLVHLDGPHDYETVRRELAYFRKAISNRCVFIFDDHDETSPGVGRAVDELDSGFTKILHRLYDTPYGRQGFSAWLHHDSVEEQ